MFDQTLHRRTLVGILAVGLAGCLSDDQESSDAGDDDTQATDDSEDDGGPAEMTDESNPIVEDPDSYPHTLVPALREMLAAEDPSAYARSKERFTYDEERDSIAVRLETKEEFEPPTELVSELTDPIETDDDTTRSARVRIDDLEAVAEDPFVELVRGPAEAIDD